MGRTCLTVQLQSLGTFLICKQFKTTVVFPSYVFQPQDQHEELWCFSIASLAQNLDLFFADTGLFFHADTEGKMKESSAKGPCIMPQVTGHSSCILFLQTQKSEDDSRPEPQAAGDALRKHEMHIHTSCMETRHSETTPLLCFEIMAKGGANHGKNFLWEKLQRFMHFCSHCVFLNRSQTCSTVYFHEFCY